MNIQPSVIVWTVICFSLMTVILNRLLFRPVLTVLDRRKEQLEQAREKKARHAMLLQQRAGEREQLLHERECRKKDRIRDQLEQIRAEEKQLLKDAQRECLARIDVYRDQTEQELEQILAAARPRVSDAAQLFAQRILSDRD